MIILFLGKRSISQPLQVEESLNNIDYDDIIQVKILVFNYFG